ncbi:interleukin-1 receptor type 2 [Bombina bombina]|uniref:interleukin-1 receptor type 2 n=1 Tax=Bombina bombina TaxID=8345 RepID=UPI00235A9FEA|nr:interleukin-1 receptor type 2 [Bombina bombina]
MKMCLPYIIIGTCLLGTTAFRVNRLENPEECQERIMHFKQYVILSGEPAMLKCPSFQYLKLDSYRTQELSLNLIWMANDSKVMDHGQESRIHSEEEYLLFFPALTEDSGIYTCILRNESFCIEVALSLSVQDATEVSLSDIAYEQIAYEESNFQIFCPDLHDFTRKITDIQLKWNKDGQALSIDNSKYIYTDGTTYLLINNVQKEDEGYYTCELAYTYGSTEYTISRIITLQTIGQEKKYNPVIVSRKDISAATGSKLVIPCKVFTGYGSTSVTLVWWLANDSYIEEFFSDSRVMEGELQETTENDALFIEVPLIFEKVIEEDFTTDFKCIARNDNGFQVLPTQIKEAASSFAWYIAAVPAVLVSLILLIIAICRYKKSEKSKDYTLTKS